MKKLNKKGVTLIELIVSFAIVSIAMIYFYQTIVDLHRMYKNSNKATDEFVNKDYALRVLDAYIKEKGVTNLSAGNVCTNYLLGYCNTANVTNEGVFSKVELKDSENNVLATSYYYTESRVVEAIDLALASKSLNSMTLKEAVESMVNDTNEQKKYTYVQGIEDGKVKYEVKYNDNIIYKKLEEQTIEEQLSGNISKTLVDDLLESKNDKWKSSKNNRVYYDEKENKYYATYDVIEKDSKKLVAQNVIKISELEKLTSIKNVNGEEQINKEYSLSHNEQPYGILVETTSNKYLLKYEVSAEKETTTGTSFMDKCIISIIQDSSNKMLEVFFDNQGIKHKGISEGLSFNEDETIKYEKNNQKSYITFYKVKFYEYNYKNYEKNDICKIKLVEAYKYK